MIRVVERNGGWLVMRDGVRLLAPTYRTRQSAVAARSRFEAGKLYVYFMGGGKDRDRHAIP
jgi:hypothetical protein